MTAHLTFKITRPSLDHPFILEVLEDLPLLAFPSNHFENSWIESNGQFVGLIDTYSDETITWEQIYSRKNELRSDINKWLEENHYNVQKNFQFPADAVSIGPLLNPFSLTLTKHFIFDTVENAYIYINSYKNFDTKNTDNTIETYLNGEPIDILAL